MSRFTKERYEPQTEALRGYVMQLQRGPSGDPAKPNRYKLLVQLEPKGAIRTELDLPDPPLTNEQLIDVCRQLEPGIAESIGKVRAN